MFDLIEKKKWIPLVGRLMLAFSSIEEITYDILKYWTNDICFTRLRKLSLSERIKLLIELSNVQKCCLENKEYLQNYLHELYTFIQYRNLIAHNQVSLVLYNNEDKETVFKEAIISNEDTFKTVEYNDLKKIVPKVEALEESILKVFLKIKIENFDFDLISKFKGLDGY